MQWKLALELSVIGVQLRLPVNQKRIMVGMVILLTMVIRKTGHANLMIIMLLKELKK